jgi:hypothetical protein
MLEGSVRDIALAVPLWYVGKSMTGTLEAIELRKLRKIQKQRRCSRSQLAF